MPKYNNIRPIAGMNIFVCPVCESTTFLPLNLYAYYKIMVNGGGKTEAKCPRAHRFDVSWAARVMGK